jgi:hypothetical protein
MAAAQVRLYKSLALYVVDIIMRAYKNRKFLSWLRWLWQSAAVRSIRHPWDSLLLLLLGARRNEFVWNTIKPHFVLFLLAVFTTVQTAKPDRSIFISITAARRERTCVKRCCCPSKQDYAIHPSNELMDNRKSQSGAVSGDRERARQRKEVMGLFRTKMCRAMPNSWRPSFLFLATT